MERLVVEYAQMGHRDGCRHELPSSSELLMRWHEQLRQEYEVLQITPHCTQDKERGAFRAEVYARAEQEADRARDRCATIRGGMKAAEKAWKTATAPWVDGPCPYFESRDG